jgi:hypothetical protein
MTDPSVSTLIATTRQFAHDITSCRDCKQWTGREQSSREIVGRWRASLENLTRQSPQQILGFFSLRGCRWYEFRTEGFGVLLSGFVIVGSSNGEVRGLMYRIRAIVLRTWVTVMSLFAEGAARAGKKVSEPVSALVYETYTKTVPGKRLPSPLLPPSR